MLCNYDPNTLATYLDGELRPDQAVAFQQHLSTCARCAAEIAGMVSLRRSLVPARTRYTPSSDFRRKIQQQIAAPKKRPAIQRFLPYAIPLAAILLLVIALFQYSRPTDAFSEIADLHVNALASANPLDVVSTDRHTVKPWFQGKIPFSFNVPELAGTGFQLLGGRLVYRNQQPGAQLIAALGQHKISVLIFQQSSALDGAFSTISKASNRNQFSVSTWRSHGLRFFVIGDTETTQIDKLSQLFKQANGE